MFAKYCSIAAKRERVSYRPYAIETFRDSAIEYTVDIRLAWYPHLLFHSRAILPYKVKRTRKICHGITSKIMYCTANPDFTGFLAEGLKKPNFDVTCSSGIINLLFDGFAYNTQ